jgi:hypothetical protein
VVASAAEEDAKPPRNQICSKAAAPGSEDTRGRANTKPGLNQQDPGPNPPRYRSHSGKRNHAGTFQARGLLSARSRSTSGAFSDAP